MICLLALKYIFLPFGDQSRGVWSYLCGGNPAGCTRTGKKCKPISVARYKLFLIVQTGFRPYTTLGPLPDCRPMSQVIMPPADSAWGMQPSDGTVYAQPVRTPSEEQGEVVILLLLLPVFSLFVFAFRPYLSTNLLVSGRMQLADQIMREKEFSSGLPGSSCMSCFRCLSSSCFGIFFLE